ncbi:nitroreductase family protein [Paraburkholderia xenovorans]|nr:nitroreductase family protein [Paraburkholderia xenovorans]
MPSCRRNSWNGCAIKKISLVHVTKCRLRPRLCAPTSKSNLKTKTIETHRIANSPQPTRRPGSNFLSRRSEQKPVGLYGAIDCGCYVSNFLLAAHDSGLATIPQAALSSYAKVVRRELSLGGDRKMVCAISFGYAGERHPANSYRTSRAPLEESVSLVSM